MSIFLIETARSEIHHGYLARPPLPGSFCFLSPSWLQARGANDVIGMVNDANSLLSDEHIT